MRIDLRQALAGVLTLSMFAMLANMIKRDQIDSWEEVRISLTSNMKYGVVALQEQNLVKVSHMEKAWNETREALKLCRRQLESKAEQSNGFITFSLTDGPEYHILQIADAVVAARQLGATLILPDIKGNRPGDKFLSKVSEGELNYCFNRENQKFGHIYDVDHFSNSLNGTIAVINIRRDKIPMIKPPVIRIPTRLSKDYIATRIEPIYRSTGFVKLESNIPSISTYMNKTEENEYLDSSSCQAMFGALHLQKEMKTLIESLVGRLRSSNPMLNGRFIAVDLQIGMHQEKACETRDHDGKSCYTAQETADFLRKIGVHQQTPIYITQTRWHSHLSPLRDIFPKTYTKDDIMPPDKKAEFPRSGSSVFERVIDFYVCSESDVFIPTVPDLFYTNVAGMRIASGRTMILIPDPLGNSSVPASGYISPYVSQKSHFAYSCFC